MAALEGPQMVTTVRRTASSPGTNAGNEVVSGWVRSRSPCRRPRKAGPRSPAWAVPPRAAEAATAAPPTSAGTAAATSDPNTTRSARPANGKEINSARRRSRSVTSWMSL